MTEDLSGSADSARPSLPGMMSPHRGQAPEDDAATFPAEHPSSKDERVMRSSSSADPQPPPVLFSAHRGGSWENWAGEIDHPALRGLPEEFSSIRDHQVEAVKEILRKFEDGNDVVFLDAPTGSGKTLIAELVRRFLGYRAVYSCTTKSLQDQFLRDYPYAKVLKGRSNYTPQEPKAGLSNATCADCTWTRVAGECAWCPDPPTCPYRMAKVKAANAELAVLNTAYYLNEVNNPGPSAFRDWQLVIIDEADTLENELMGYVSVEMPQYTAKRYKIDPPKKVTKNESWIEWVNDAIPKVRGYLSGISSSTLDLKKIRARKSADQMGRKLKALQLGLEEETWIYTGKKDSPNIEFKPVRVDGLGMDILWGQGRKFLLMSATWISPAEAAASLGLERNWGVVSVPSTFAPARRPVYVSPVTEMRMGNKDEAYPKMAMGVNEILKRHPTDRILVHTVSYGLSGYLETELLDPTSRVFSYQAAAGREKAIQRLRETENGVLLGASLDRGVDLPDDACRVIVICKIPFLNLGDKQIAARLYGPGGQLWYNVATVRTLVQMCGRGMRSEDDHCTTYILDSQFLDKVYRKNKSLLPKWWQAALKFDVNLMKGRRGNGNQS